MRLWFLSNQDEMQQFKSARQHANSVDSPMGVSIGETTLFAGFPEPWRFVRFKVNNNRKSLSAWLAPDADTEQTLKRYFGDDVVVIKTPPRATKKPPPQPTEDDTTMQGKAVINQEGNASNGESNGTGNGEVLPILLFAMNHTKTARTFGMMAGEPYFQTEPVNDEAWLDSFERMAS